MGFSKDEVRLLVFMFFVFLFFFFSSFSFKDCSFCLRGQAVVHVDAARHDQAF